MEEQQFILFEETPFELTVKCGGHIQSAELVASWLCCDPLDEVFVYFTWLPNFSTVTFLQYICTDKLNDSI